MITTTAMSQKTRNAARIVSAAMMLAGVLAILLPFYVGFATAVMLGVAIAAVGAVGLLITRQVRQAGYVYTVGSMYWLYLIAGLLLALMPQVTLGIAAFLLGFFLLMAGVMSWRSASVTPGASKLTGGVAIALGILIVMSGASGAAWLIGLFFGVSVFLMGLSLWQSVSQAPVILE